MSDKSASVPPAAAEPVESHATTDGVTAIPGRLDLRTAR
jgi:hypothetical protein